MGIHYVDVMNVYRVAFVAGVANAAPIVHQLLRTFLLSKKLYRESESLQRCCKPGTQFNQSCIAPLSSPTKLYPISNDESLDTFLALALPNLVNMRCSNS